MFIPAVLLVKIQALLSQLDDTKNHEIICKKIFLILDRIIPYYPINLRDAFGLVSVFSRLENLRVIFFKILNKILARVPKSFLFEQIQMYCLGAMLFWTSHSQSKNFFLIIDVLLILEKQSLESLLLDDLTEHSASFLLPSPLRIIDSVTQYFEAERLDDKNNNKLQVLNNIKTSFFKFQQQNHLQTTLRRDFIVFMNNLLDFALTADIKDRIYIIDHYKRYHPLIKKIFFRYDGVVMTDSEKILSTMILEMLEKCKTCIIHINLEALDQSVQTGRLLSEQEKIERLVHTRQLLTQVLSASLSKKTRQIAQQFPRPPLKHTEEPTLSKKKHESIQ